MAKGLFLGGKETGKFAEIFLDLGIKRVLNVTELEPNTFEGKFEGDAIDMCWLTLTLTLTLTLISLTLI